MTIEEYIKACERTSRGLNTFEERISNFSLGLCGETTEVYELFKVNGMLSKTALIKEIGDVLWYLWRFVSVLTTDYTRVTMVYYVFNDFYNHKTGQLNVCRISEYMVTNAGKIADMVKKTAFHGHKMNNNIVLHHLGCIYNLCTLLLNCFGMTIEEAMIANVEKLKLRYPDGFKVEASINRKD